MSDKDKTNELAEAIVDLKLQKAKHKSAFTKTKNKILQLIDNDSELIDKKEIQILQENFDMIEDCVVETLERLCSVYRESGDKENARKVTDEIDIISAEYAATHKAVFSALECQKSNSSIASSSSEDASHDLGKDMWRQLKRVSIPVFNGEKRRYESWKAAFNACIESAPATKEYKLLQLRQYLSGDALKAIENLGHSAASYDAAKERLERKFGGQRRQIVAYLEELDRYPAMKEESAKNLEKFADLLDIAVINMKEAGKDSDLMDGALYLKLQRKLPETMLTRYHRWIYENSEEESVETLRQWINQESQYYTIASETIYGLENADKEKKKAPKQDNKSSKNNRSYFAEAGSDDSAKPSCAVCNDKHNIWNCEKFKKLNVSDRWAIAKQHKLCFRCLRNDHRGSECRTSRKCGIENCNKTHNRLLHVAGKPESTLRSEATEFTPMTFTSNQTKSLVALRTVPVFVKANNRTLKINALLDDGSSKSYINQDVASELGLDGNPEIVKVNLLNGRTESFVTKSVNFTVESLNGFCKMNIEAHTTSHVTGNLKAVDWQELSSKWKHLRNIQFPTVSTKDRVDLLIGVDYSDLHQSIQEVHGEKGEPIARLTPLGWTCVGQTTRPSNEEDSYFTFFAVNLDSTLRKFWEIEHDTIETDRESMSPEDAKVIEKTQQSIVNQDGMYEVSIPWKEQKDALLNNYNLALNRLKNTEKRLNRDMRIRQVYADTIVEYEKKGYISKVSLTDRDAAGVWYLPHFQVIREDKETTKVRIVFDASAKYENVCLNDVIFQGPKLQNELFNVLLRFRRYPVAFVCDIAEMYLRVGINVADRPFHRFLWKTDTPEIYQFNRLVFGVNASPFLAQFIARHNALKHSYEFPMASETVINSTYMDDNMDSTPTERQAIEQYRQLTQLWSKAGMYARKWLSNSTKVLEDIPVQDRAFEVDLSKGELPATKTLGVRWLAEDDKFMFQYSIPDESMTLTKRNFFKKIASIFDPHGLIAP